MSASHHASHHAAPSTPSARDAATGGDRVLAENYLQHAEHYFRVLRAVQPQVWGTEIFSLGLWIVSGKPVQFYYHYLLPGTFLIAGLATLSLPGLASFISEFLVFIGTFTRYPVPAVIAAAGLVLSAIYVLWLYQRMMTGPVTYGNEKLPDLRARELLVVVPLIAALIALGVYPKIALNVINPAVGHTLTGIHVTDPAPTLRAEVPR